MGLLTRKRKRPPTKPVISSTPRETDHEDVEQMRTEANDSSRPSLADITPIQNLETSHGRSEESAELCCSQKRSRLSQMTEVDDTEVANNDEPMRDNDGNDDERPIDINEAQMRRKDSNDEINYGWSDGEEIIGSQIPSETQVERTAESKSSEEERNAMLNLPECGTIQSITLQNFMCHENFHLDFGPRINFIVGRNGSGKSAILTAIVLGFGGRAATTSRGKGIASFIKSGETQAKIILTICNHNERGSGKNGFRTEDFGKSIVIERTLNSSGASTYKIKSAAGKVIADRKDVLEDIIRYFNIQVDNPVCVLNQEVSRNFLNTKNARDKYMFFMKATLLEDMKNEYSTAEQQRNQAEVDLINKEKVLPEVVKDVKRLEQKVKMFNALEDHKEKFIKLNNEALWCLVNEQKAQVEAIRAQVDVLTTKAEEEAQKVNLVKEKINSLNNEHTQAVQRLNGFVKEVQTLQDCANQLKAECEQVRERLRLKEKDLRSVKNDFRVNERDIEELEKKIQKLNEQFGDDITNRRRAEIERLKQDIEQLKEEDNYINRGYQEIRESVDRMTEEKLRLNQECNRLSADLTERSRNIDRIEQSRNETLQRFGPQYPEIVRRIEDAHKRGVFKKKPLGPIGHYIQLKDNSCALAVEMCLKRTIFAFCCDNRDDANKLNKMMFDVFGADRSPQIITRPFGRLHDVSKYRVTHDRYHSLLDLMTIKEAPIANALIDQSRIESILFIPDYNEAQDLLMDMHSVPANCFYAMTAEGETMYPSTHDSTYRSYANSTNRKRSQYLMKNVDQLLPTLKNEVKELKEVHKRKELELRESSKALEAKQKETQPLEARKKKIRKDIFEKDMKLKQLESIGDSPPVEVSTLEEELQTYHKKKSDFQQRIDTLIAEREEISQSVTEAEDKWREKQDEYHRLMAEKEPMKERLEKIKRDSEKHKLLLDSNETALKTVTKNKEEEERKLAAKEEELVRDQEVALQQTGEPVETNRSSKTVYKEIKQMEAFLDEQESTIGNKDEILDKYQTSLNHYKKVRREITAIEKHLKKLKESLELRKRGYSELRKFITMMTIVNFKLVLRNKNFSGDLKIYHTNHSGPDGEQKKAKTLEIKVNPKNDDQNDIGSQESVICSYSDTRSLSGGERSFSTVAFILALWESAQSPFKILDEVDVFMDLVTRQISLDAMIEFAATKSGKQYIFLSPLKIQKLINPELIEIFQMPEPQRTE